MDFAIMLENVEFPLDEHVEYHELDSTIHWSYMSSNFIWNEWTYEKYVHSYDIIYMQIH
jgi:hypothetical protein